MLFVGLMDDLYLMRLAKLGITSAELFQLGVFLEMKTTVREVQRGSGDDVSRAFTLLERWRDSTKAVSNSAELFDQLSGACRETSRADLVEHVRCGESVKPETRIMCNIVGPTLPPQQRDTGGDQVAMFVNLKKTLHGMNPNCLSYINYVHYSHCIMFLYVTSIS